MNDDFLDAILANPFAAIATCSTASERAIDYAKETLQLNDEHAALAPVHSTGDPATKEANDTNATATPELLASPTTKDDNERISTRTPHSPKGHRNATAKTRHTAIRSHRRAEAPNPS